MNTELEIQEMIKKNLPRHVGDALKARLEQAEEDAEKIIDLESKISQLEKSVNKQSSELLSYKLLDERNSRLNEREEVLNKKQHDLDLEILKQKLESEKDKSEFVRNVALGLVRNTEFRKSVFDNEDRQGYYKDNVWVEPVHLSKSRNETSSTD